MYSCFHSFICQLAHRDSRKGLSLLACAIIAGVRGIVPTLFMCVLTVCVLASCKGSEPSGKNPYFQPDSIAQERVAKDRYWREGENSPLRKEDKALFQGLAYFAPNPEYCIAARFESLPTQDTVRILTNDNEVRLMLRVGRLHFVVGKDSCHLTAYRYTGLEGKMQRGYFVPFKDATNGTDSYRPGRFLDVEIPRANKPFILDFNRAFNPYCNYNEEYSCPLVPQENILAVRIEAGEKVFFHPRK
ncbi:MAG: DUF1684 domain-containing protein [Ignavibacteria bacterium]|nr:DUF1684 domain-containing protein [Ignavibacteria bacterium]